MTDSVLKQMGIQQWRLRQSEPAPAVEPHEAEPVFNSLNTENVAIAACDDRPVGQSARKQEPFDPNQMWSNEPESHDDFSTAVTTSMNPASTNRPLSEELRLRAGSDAKSKANTSHLAKPSLDTRKGSKAKSTPSLLPKLMPAPAPIDGQAPAAVFDEAPAAIFDDAPAAIFDEESSADLSDVSPLAPFASGDQTGQYTADHQPEAPEATSKPSAHDPIAHLDWQGLQALIDQQNYCQTCGSTNSILGSGDANADWMFVTDAPSQSDLSLLQLFSGRAGQLYEAMLLAIGLDRATVYTTSVFKCTAPADQSLTPNCDKLLRRQIELVQPKVIICFGEFASQSVLRSNESLEVLRTQQSMCYQTQTPVVATYNPVQLLEQAELKAGAWHDLKKCLALNK